MTQRRFSSLCCCKFFMFSIDSFAFLNYPVFVVTTFHSSPFKCFLLQPLEFCAFNLCESTYVRMATSATPGILTATTKPCAYSSCKVTKPGTAIFISSWARLNCSSQISSAPFFQNFPIISAKPQKFVTKALSEASNSSPLSGLPIDLRGAYLYIFFFHYILLAPSAFKVLARVVGVVFNF